MMQYPYEINKNVTKHAVSKKIRETKTPNATQNEHVFKCKQEYQKTKERPITRDFIAGITVSTHCKLLVCHRRRDHVLAVHTTTKSIHNTASPKKRFGKGRYVWSQSSPASVEYRGGALLLFTCAIAMVSIASELLLSQTVISIPTTKDHNWWWFCCC
jgi:hypothetical protein